ncbi:MAG TPA: amidohydrolase [Rectinemataceae bacterium]|nr:amidohydrolase [Rectinemataceae bacterium]
MSSTVWKNGRFITLDPLKPRVEAIVVRDGEIAFTGEAGEALARAGEGAGVRDLGGRCVVPGFNDNHVHALILGDHALAPDLGGLDGPGIVTLLRERFAAAPAGQILMAYNWDYPACPNPRKELLDEAFPRNPVMLSQFSGHAQWLSSQALRAIGITKESRDPPIGQVLRDADGEPTGIVRDLGDTALLKRRFHGVFFNRNLREQRLALALDTFRRFGITSVQDNAWFYPELFSLARLRRAGKLSLRFTTWSLGRNPWTTPAMRFVGALGGFDRDWVRAGPVKYFLDGAFSTRTACLCEPYADDPGGGLCADPAAPTAELEFLARKGLQGAFHIIGDRGIALFLDAVEEARTRHPDLGRLRIRIEHAQLIRERDIPRLRDLGILVAAQPSALGSPEKDERLLGPRRARRAYAYRSLLDAGVQLSFGSDIPGEATCDPLLSIHMAVNREGPERISPLEALRCYTVGSAYAEFMEERKGMLRPGMLADFAVLSDDLTEIPPGRIKEIRVEETVVGGRSVYSREAE